ncbi:MAG: secretin and TonB N-terminal domain-containing protein, partial [Candidatus Omnitrophica bacterium]|nr:secretin and TonB N-terminal domain-containing protein [Candidatus Omnitrophota bacterium]
MKRSKSYEGVFAYGSALLFALSCLLNATLLFAQNPPSGISSSPVSEEVTTPEAATVQVTTTAPGNVSIDFKDADIGNVLRILSLKSQVNIVAGPEVKGTVTIRLEDVPWEKALDVVLRTYGYVYEREGNIVRVTTKENLSTEELATETFILNYTTAVEAETAIKDILSERGRIKSVPRTNMLVVTDIPTNLYKIREVIRKLDKSTPQAHIDSKIVKTQLQKGENLGITWTPGVTVVGAERPTTLPFPAERRSEDHGFFEAVFGKFFPQTATAVSTNAFDTSAFPRPAVAVTNQGGGNLFTLGTLDFSSFSAVLQLLRTRAYTKVISNPRITVLNNQVASVKVTKDVPYPTYERN